MCYVYVFAAQDGSPLKVGTSYKPRVRLTQVDYTFGSPLHISALRWYEYDASAIEARAQKILAPFNAGGEWFRVRPSVALLAIRQAAQDVARAKTGPKIKPAHFSARPECQRYYRAILERPSPMDELRARAADKDGKPMAPATLVKYLGKRKDAQRAYQAGLKRSATAAKRKDTP